MADKPVVWVCTPLKDFSIAGPARDIEDVLGKLDDHYADPIREIGRWGECPWHMVLNIMVGGGIYQARNRAATDFLLATRNDNDRLLFKDYDILAGAQDYADLLSHDLSIVGALYTTREENGHWVMNPLAGARPSARGILPVMELGTGFKCFKRSVLVKALSDNPWIACASDPDHSRPFYSFFNMGPVWDKKLWPGIGRGLTEDYWFDWITRESGFVTCADTKIKLRHYDEHTGRSYPAQFPNDPGILPLEAKE